MINEFEPTQAQIEYRTFIAARNRELDDHMRDIVARTGFEGGLPVIAMLESFGYDGKNYAPDPSAQSVVDDLMEKGYRGRKITTAGREIAMVMEQPFTAKESHVTIARERTPFDVLGFSRPKTDKGDQQ